MKRVITAALFSLTLTAPLPALAGGGTGGGSLSSPSGPSYDPVEEYNKGRAAIEAKDFETAEKALKRVVRVAKKDANSHFLLGIAHYGQDEFGPAAKSFAKAVKYDPSNYGAHARLVLSYAKNGKAAKAETAEAKLSAANAACAGTCPEAAEIANAIAMIEANRDGGVEVSSLPQAFQQASLSNVDSVYSGALRLINLEQYNEGIAELEAAGRVVGPHPDVLTYLGFANRKLGNTEAAFSYYAAALEIAPNHLSANEYLGEYYVERGELDQANAQLDKLEALCPYGCAQIVELKRWIEEADA